MWQTAAAIVTPALIVLAGIAAFTGHLTQIADSLTVVADRVRRRSSTPSISYLADEADMGRWQHTGEMEGGSPQLRRVVRFFLRPTSATEPFRVTNVWIEGVNENFGNQPFLKLYLTLEDVDTGGSPTWPATSAVHLSAELPRFPEGRYLLDSELTLCLQDEKGREIRQRIPNHAPPDGQRPNVLHQGHDGNYWIPTNRGWPRKLRRDEQPPFERLSVDEWLERDRAETQDLVVVRRIEPDSNI